MGHRFRFGARIGLCQHHQRATGRRSPHPIQRRHAHQGIGGSHPPEIQIAPFHGIDLLTHGQARGVADRSRREAPVLFNGGPMLGVGHRAIARQQLGQAPHLATTHGIGLTR